MPNRIPPPEWPIDRRVNMTNGVWVPYRADPSEFTTWSGLNNITHGPYLPFYVKPGPSASPVTRNANKAKYPLAQNYYDFMVKNVLQFPPHVYYDVLADRIRIATEMAVDIRPGEDSYIPYDDDYCVHAQNSPAFTFPNGGEVWVDHGILHCEHGPAISIHIEVQLETFSNYNGNSDWPATHRTAVRKEWYRHGRLHRSDGPAIEYGYNDYGEWWQNGLLHRCDGPAIINNQGLMWFYQGRRIPDIPDGGTVDSNDPFQMKQAMDWPRDYDFED